MPAYSQRKGQRLKARTTESGGLDTSKPTALFKPSKPRAHTVSIAIPGSIIANCQSHDLKNTLAGQIGRAAAVFCVDEIVVFNDGQGRTHRSPNDGALGSQRLNGSAHGANARGAYQQPTDGYTGDADPEYFLAHLLSYLETPPHLRMRLFGLHPDLRTAGALPSLDMPHHLRRNESSRYREGITVEAPGAGSSAPEEAAPPGKKQKRKRGASTEKEPAMSIFVETGLPRLAVMEEPLPLQTRVTVELKEDSQGASDKQAYASVRPVAPSAPREDAGYYWGYNVRRASSLSAVFTEAPFEGGYDVSVGMSERGVPLDKLQNLPIAKELRQYNHLLLVFGGVAGLEAAVGADEDFKRLGVLAKDAARCFDAWVDLCPGQGSRTIRAEEALWLGLMGMRPWVRERGQS